MGGEHFIEMIWRCGACREVVAGRSIVCPRCGKAKTTEEYEMPSDVASAPVIEDASLLALAKGGENWSCRYCGSDQRRADGECARCGGDRTASGSSNAGATAPSPTRPAGVDKRLLYWIAAGAAVLVLSTIFLLVLVARDNSPDSALETSTGDPAFAPPPAPAYPRVIDARVVSLRWEHTVSIERWQILPGEGFAEQRPSDAMEVKPAGQRVHHQDSVPDGFTTESYTVDVPDGYRTESYTETVSDGYTTESYTEQESCGQDCRTTPRTCSKSCTSQKNGFAKCTDVCSGGTTSCTTKYCSRTKSRQVPKTKTVTKTRQVPKTRSETRTRQVPKTKQVDRFAAWFSWKYWGWAEDRAPALRGDSLPTAWPDETSLRPSRPLKNGERERSSKKARYELNLDGGPLGILSYNPDSIDAFSSLAPGLPMRVTLRAAGVVDKVEPTETSAPAGAASGPTASSASPPSTRE